MADRPRKLFLTALIAVTFLGPLAVHMYIPVLPHIQKAFGISPAMAQFSLSLVIFVMALGTLFYGSLSDRYGRRGVLIAGLILFGVGSAICVVADQVAVLLAGRLVQAAGAGCGIVLARAMARDVYGADKLAQVIAYITAAYVLGPMFAPPLGGAMVDAWGWSSIFVFATIVSVAVLVFAAVILGETRRGPPPGTRPIRLLSSYARLLRSPVFVGYALNPAFTSGSFFALATGASFVMSDVYNRSAAEFGLWFMLLPLGFMAGNFTSGRIGHRYGIPRMVMTGSNVSLAGAVFLALALVTPTNSPTLLFAAGFFIATGQGLSLPQAQAAAINVDGELTGTASGLVVFLHLSASAACVQLVGLLHDGTLVPTIAVTFGATLLASIFAIYGNTQARKAALAANAA